MSAIHPLTAAAVVLATAATDALSLTVTTSLVITSMARIQNASGLMSAIRDREMRHAALTQINEPNSGEGLE